MGVDNETVSSERSLQEAPTKGQKWRSHIWVTWAKSKQEQRLLRKVDYTLLVFGFLGTFTKFLDKTNLQTAFVSGMKEELGFYGIQLNYATTCYNVGLIVALWPASLILVRTKPKYFITAIQLLWSICTFAKARMNTAGQMYALRTLIGIFETGHYSGIMYLCGSWYQSRELGVRLSLVNTASQIGPMAGAYLQSAAYKGLDGVSGMSGWRWLMMIDGIISIVVTLPQIVLLPEVPSRLVANWMFTEEEVILAKDRQPKEGRAKQGSFTLPQVRRWFTTLEIWLLWVISVCNMIGMQPSLSLNFWFKGWNTVKPGSFTVPQINDYTTPMYAVILVTTVSMAWISDTFLNARRWPMVVLGCTINAIVCIILGATPVYPHNRAFRWFLYYNSGWGEASNCMFWAWTSEILAGDPATRSFALAGLNVWAAVFAATIPLAVFKTVDQPAVVSGNYTAAGFLFCQVFTSLALAALVQRKANRGDEESDRPVVEISENSSTSDVAGVEETFPEKA
ncbi:major facilitator superfamily domain-containing protein [Exophiala viscosa]|uniref:Major facilitator superfamily domain-containing protein n=1 Tax=Exophiala viscosa TaxID=2486360 RepID=A0AAN6E5M8_9EURO|nr:major facilitator superfamily domain-containing protein [Exophiala viscosa]KAI1629393.1 major facilitator superfamily domain-containing protein [Exophiala viscosa]